MRDDLVVPGEGEENYVLARDARVVTVPFSPWKNVCRRKNRRCLHVCKS